MEKKYQVIFLEVVIFAVISYLGLKVFKDEYLFNWLLSNMTFFLFIIITPLVLAFFNQTLLSKLLAFGTVSGIFIGNFLGAYLRNLNIAKIVDGMTNQEKARLHLHHGFSIMLAIILLSLIIGIIMQIKSNKIKAY